MAEKGASIVIKKVKKGGGHGHHGGAWKVAYADFVTAMMAFFMVMWLMGSDEETKAVIEHYFNHPNTPYNMGRDPASDVSKPLGEEAGSGESILRSTNGVFEDVDNQSSKHQWEVEHANLRVQLEEKLKDQGAYGMQSSSESLKFSIPLEILFDGNSANLKADAFKHLDKIAKAIEKYRGQFVITAHTADRHIASDEFQSNWDLSAARATIVLRYFMDKHGYDPKRISAMGFSDSRPLLDNVNENNRQKNSRIEFVLTRRKPAP